MYISDRKGVSPTSQSGRYTLSYPRGLYVNEGYPSFRAHVSDIWALCGYFATGRRSRICHTYYFALLPGVDGPCVNGWPLVTCEWNPRKQVTLCCWHKSYTAMMHIASRSQDSLLRVSICVHLCRRQVLFSQDYYCVNAIIKKLLCESPYG